MESDSVRTMGDSTLVDLWIEGKSRAITISRQAIESFLRLDSGSSLGEDARREFVRTHLSLVVKAAAARLRADPQAVSLVIDHLGGEIVADRGERRSGDRRKGERRKLNLGPPSGIERRKS